MANRSNPVAKFSRKFNKGGPHKDRKKEERRNARKRKHKQRWDNVTSG